MTDERLDTSVFSNTSNTSSSDIYNTWSKSVNITQCQGKPSFAYYELTGWKLEEDKNSSMMKAEIIEFGTNPRSQSCSLAPLTTDWSQVASWFQTNNFM